MTAINFIQAGPRAFLLVDGAVIDTNGDVLAIDDKGFAVPHMIAYAATNGSIHAADLVRNGILASFEDIDDLANHGEPITRMVRDEAAKRMPDLYGDDEAWSFVVMGWSAEKDRPRAVYFASNLDTYWNADCENTWAPTLEPDWTREFIATLRAAGGRARFDPETHGMALMEAQRARQSTWTDGRFGKHFVGGHADVIELTRDGFTRRRLHTWAEDRVGHPIEPKGLTRPANVTAIGPHLNRRQRRAAARRKAVA